MSKILVIAPHPDDETLGCGGSILSHKKFGDELFWLICTHIQKVDGWSKSQIACRKNEIKKVSKIYCFNNIYDLNIPAARVDTVPLSELIKNIGNIIKKVSPNILYIPFNFDVHTDHRILSNAIQSSIKWFRYPYLQKVLMYETLSETDFNFIGDQVFRPNVFMNISDYLNEKIGIMKIYESELKEHPFPRSEQSIIALATLRGSQSGFKSAEAFQLVFERNN